MTKRLFRILRFALYEECGDKEEAAAGFVETPIARTESGDKTKRDFSLGDTLRGAGEELRVCYCEYGKCDLPERFAQDAGLLRLDTVSCEEPLTEEPNASLEPGKDVGHILKHGQRATYYCDEGNSVTGKVNGPRSFMGSEPAFQVFDLSSVF